VSELVVVTGERTRPEWAEWQAGVEARPDVRFVDGRVTGVLGEDAAGGVTIGGVGSLDTDAVFVSAGATPASGLFNGLAETDGHGRPVTDEEGRTAAAGLYAVGDVESGAAETADAAPASGRHVAAALVRTRR
jgi:thioredoxin reductase